MGVFVDSVKNDWLDDFTSSTTYVALFVGDPSDGGTELSSSNYARKSVAAADWNAASSGSLTNANAITFVQATGEWSASDITYWALYDAASDGNLLAYDELAAGQQQPIAANNTVEFAAGDITLEITDPT